jgi:tRNA pseudouridine32 synthase/23S rRNA pseudouridine746 synthase
MHPTILVVYEHSDFIVVNKPCGIQMHDPINGICQILCAQLSLDKLYLVHRLDAATSGCLLLAKTKDAAAVLSALFANKQIEKYYIAISDLKPKKKQGKIAGDMKKSRRGSYMLTPCKEGHASAVTFFISEAFHSIGRLYYVKPVTGKTHQIRVALKSLGSTILGDARYKGSTADRLYLHSTKLYFTYQNHTYDIECWPQEGEYFTPKLLQDLRKINQLDWPKYKPPRTNLNELLP